MAAAGSEQKELLALMHQHLVQIGYEKAAKELLRQSRQKNFPAPSVPLEDIFIQWKKASFQAQKRKGDDIKTHIPAKIRIPDPKSSSETSEEEDETNPMKTNLPVNNSSTAKAQSSSEDEDSSSEEEEVSGKMAKTAVTGNQTANFLQLAAQKASSVPGKGVAVAAVQAKDRPIQAKDRPNKTISNKASPLAVAKAGQNKALSGKPEAASPPQVLKGQSTAPVSVAQKAADSENSSSSSESEEEKTSTAVKTPAPKPAPKKPESSSEDSSEDSDSEEEEEATNAATVQVKPSVQSPQISATPVKSSLATVPSSKGSTVKAAQVLKGKSTAPVSVTQKAADSESSSSSSESEEEKTSTAVKTPAPKPAPKKPESSSEDSSEDSDSEEEEATNAATVQVKPSVQSPQISATPVKSSPATVPSSKGSTVKAAQILKGKSTAPSTAVKTPAPKPAPKKPESSSEDSSEDSDSDSEEEATNAATVQVKPSVQSPQISATPVKSSPAMVPSSKGSTVKVSPAKKKVKPAVQSPQISGMPVKSSPATVTSSKGSTVKASPAKTKVSQGQAGFGNAAESSQPADSSDTSDSSDSEDEESSSVALAKSSEKTPQASAASVKNAPPNILPSKAASTPTPLKQTPKPSVPSLAKPAVLPPAKVAGSAESSESSESSSESENEAPPVPVSQKRLQTPRPPTGVKHNQAAKPGTPVKAPSSALKRKETKSESSSSSDSEVETVPAAENLPPPSATKSNAAPQLTHAKTPCSPAAPLKASQQSEDSSQDSSDESDSEEDTVFTQKPTPVTQKPLLTPRKAVAAKTTGAAMGKAGSVQPAGESTANPMSSATASLQKAPESSETDSSDSSESEEDGKPAKQEKVSSNKAATLSGKAVQVNSVTPDSISNNCQGKPPATAQGKVELSSSKPSQSQTLLAKPSGILKHEENSSSSSSDSEEEEVATAPLATSTQISQRAGIAQKQGTTKEADSSSEESSDEELEPSQSLLAGYPGLFKTPTAAVQKSVAPKPSKQGPGKTASTTGTPAFNALAKSPEKMSPADIPSSDSSDSNSDAEEIPAGPKAETGAILFSAKKAVVAKKSKSATVGKTGLDSVASKATPAKKATAKSQRKGKAKGNAAVQLPLIAHTESGGTAVAQDPRAGAQGDIQATPVVAVKTPKTVKPSKAGVKEKQKKKRKLDAGETGLGEPKRKKRKGQSGSEVGKKKKKSKSSSKTKEPKEKDGKGKKSKKGKNKKLSSVTSDGSLLLKKKKKKKKKTSDLKEAV